MNIGGSIVVLVIAWWIAFQALLPVGVKSPAELGQSMAGDPGAPVRPNLLRKGLWAAVIAVLIWGVLFALVHYSGLSFDDFPSP
jgi:predicted secreted protein